MTDFTAHFRFAIPDFNQEPWHAELIAAIRAVDTAIYEALLVQGVGNWTNSKVYAVGAIVIDAATGLMWTCGVANTSSASPTTFAQERVAHPTFWNATANIPQQRGTWVTATSYIPGDFVIDSNRYAVCLIPHVSGVFNTDLAAARWSVLIDLSALGVGLNATAEDTIAAAATTDIGSKAATRLSVTGSAVITSLGVVANTYKILRFAAGSTLTNNVNILLFSANILTEVNDVAFFSSDATGKWRLYFYSRASGVPLGQPDASETVKGIAELATQAETNAGADDLRIVTPLKMVTYVSAAISTAVNGILGGVGATLDTLFEIANAIGLLAPKANPTFTGTIEADQIHTTGNANLAGGTTLPAGDIILADLAQTAGAFQKAEWHGQDQKSNGTTGDLLTAGQWSTRTLNTEIADDLGVTLSGNQVTLLAGTYEVMGDAVAYFIGSTENGGNNHVESKLRLRNVTDGNSPVVGNGIRYRANDDSGGNRQGVEVCLVTTMSGRFTIVGTRTFELQSWIASNLTGTVTAASQRGGVAISSGEPEVYADLRIWKIG